MQHHHGHSHDHGEGPIEGGAGPGGNLLGESGSKDKSNAEKSGNQSSQK